MNITLTNAELKNALEMYLNEHELKCKQSVASVETASGLPAELSVSVELVDFSNVDIH